MCMMINNDVKLPTVDKDGYCVGYKIVMYNNSSFFFDHFKYKLGLNVSGRVSKELVPYETINQQVDAGLHIFLDLKETKKEFRARNYKYFRFCPLNLFSLYRDEKIIKVYFKPEDVIATGFYFIGCNSKNAVVMQLFIKSLKPLGFNLRNFVK